jgi:hypothetical protein
MDYWTEKFLQKMTFWLEFNISLLQEEKKREFFGLPLATSTSTLLTLFAIYYV